MSKRPGSKIRKALTNRSKPAREQAGRQQINTVRIISGTHRTRKIQFPDAPGLRPSSDRVRETLFNWIRNDVPGARCLDLFAGSGALGIEALSRGAAWVEFVESNAQVHTALTSSLNKLALTNANISRCDALDWITEKAAPGQTFSLVFLDPPFAEKLLPQVCEKLQASGVFAPRTKIYIEVDAAEPEPELPDNWQLTKSKRAGNVRFSLYTAVINDADESE